MTKILFALVLLLLGTLSLPAKTTSSWTNPRGNAQLQGVTNVVFPQKIKKNMELRCRWYF